MPFSRARLQSPRTQPTTPTRAMATRVTSHTCVCDSNLSRITGDQPSKELANAKADDRRGLEVFYESRIPTPPQIWLSGKARTFPRKADVLDSRTGKKHET